MIKEKCVFCDQYYSSPIDKAIDICPTCEYEAIEDYYDPDNQDFKDMIMTYSDKVLGEHR